MWAVPALLLLLAPLTKAAGRWNLRGELPGVLDALTVEDSAAVFAAIRLAKPAGLGQALEQDVANEPTLPLREIMALAADRETPTLCDGRLEPRLRSSPGADRFAGLVVGMIKTHSANLLHPQGWRTLLDLKPGQRTPFLTYYIYFYSLSDDPGEQRLAWAAAVVLLAFVMVLNVGIRLLAGHRAIQASRAD